MNIKDLLKLNTHEEVVDLLLSNTNEDYFVHKSAMFTIIIPNGIDISNPAPMLCVHTDTVSSLKPSKFLLEGDTLTNPDGVLGADDRAGCWIVNELLKAKENRFIIGIFDEEESGGIGSSELMKSEHFNKLCITESSSIVSCFIGLDRRGGDEVAYYGMESESFELAIETTFPQLNPAIGSFTDASNLAFGYQISCCNLSVGYYKEHTAQESLNVSEMENILKILKETDMTMLSSCVYDVEYTAPTDYSWRQDDFDYEIPLSSKYRVIKCDVCGLPDTLYEGAFGLKACEYCIADLDEEYDDDHWM